MRRRRSQRALAFAATAWLLSSGCGSEGGSHAAEPQAARVSVGYSALRISLPLFVAEQRGLFRKHGLAVTLKRYDTAQPLVEEVLDGRIEAAGYAALPIVFTAASRGGRAPRLATLLVEDAAHPVSRLLRRKGDGRIGTVADLAGKTVGVLPTVAYRRWLEVVLRHAQVDPASVRVVPVAPPQQVSALGEGGVDALLTGDPMATAAVARGVAESFGPAAPVPDALGGEVRFGSFLVGDKLARERPLVARQVVAAIDEAIALIAADPEAARAAMADFLRPEERAWMASYPVARYAASGTLTADGLAQEVQTQVRLGILERPIDTAGWVMRLEAAQ